MKGAIGGSCNADCALARRVRRRWRWRRRQQAPGGESWTRRRGSRRRRLGEASVPGHDRSGCQRRDAACWDIPSRPGTSCACGDSSSGWDVSRVRDGFRTAWNALSDDTHPARARNPCRGRADYREDSPPSSPPAVGAPSPDRAQRSLDDPFSGRGGRLLRQCRSISGPGGLGLGGVVDPLATESCT